jgi:hypothetical protein
MDPLNPESDLAAGSDSQAGDAKPGPDDRWTVPDLIDFEYYVELDEQALRERPAAYAEFVDRDRSLYLDYAVPGLAAKGLHTPLHRRWSLRRWLTARRNAELPDARDLLPGTAFARAQRLVILALAAAGFLVGIGAASALLSYDGHHPVNVAWYMLLLVGLQFVVIGGGALAWALRGSRPVGTAVQDLTLLGRLIRPLFTWFGRLAQHHRLAHASQEVRDRALAGTGMLKSQYLLYGPVSYLPVLVPAQVFGVTFNLGVILTTVALEWFTDLAFGWGSALDVGPQAVYDLAHTLATPWSWLFGEGLGYPNLEQVAGSRINLKDPLFLLNADHLRSWRWFLVLSVLTYGLLPRLVLLSISLFVQRRVLNRLPFTHARTQALYARLVTPRLETGTRGSGQGPAMPIPAPIAPRKYPEPRPAPESEAEREPEAGSEILTAAPVVTGGIAPDACLLLLHVDVDDLIEEDDRLRLAQLIMAHTGWQVAGAASFGSGSLMTEGVVRWVAGQAWQAPPARVVIVMDGSQPPITENLRLLRELRLAAGARAQLLLALVGDPQDADPLRPVRAFDYTDWQRKIDALGDPYLRLTMLAPTRANGEE